MKILNKVFEKDKSVFIADAHWRDYKNNEGYKHVDSQDLLRAIDSLSSKQVFLMGDIAQVLLGNLNSSCKANKRLLGTLDSASHKNEIFYFEGNHDFGLEFLKARLPNITFIPRAQQPIVMKISNSDKTICLAHGDLFLPLKYKIYINLLNSYPTLKTLYYLDRLSKGKIYAFFEAKINAKKIKCFKGSSTRKMEFCKARMHAYKKYFANKNIMPDIFVEGHFHLDYEFREQKLLYICLSAFMITSKIHTLEKIKC